MAGETGGLRGKKRYLFEGGIRVPAIIRFPGLTTPGTVLTTPVTALDLLPTIAEITGASVPNDRPIDGRSLVNLLKGGVFDRAGPLYWSIPTPDGMEYAIRSGNWKLILDGSGTPRYLFNLAEDFYEVHNKLTSHPDRVTELEKQFNRYRRDIDSDPIRRARET
jgi:N-acetylgalactosamine-6-sulfatase